MKNNKIKLATALVAGALILTGCGTQAKTSKVASQKTTSSSVKSNSSKRNTSKEASSKVTSSSSQKQADTLWDSTKDAQLKTFIDKWAPTMKQSYVKYDGEHSIKTSVGTVYPDNLTKVTVNGAKTSIGWSKNGKGSNSYNVVAIYNYNGTEPPLPNHITYFFAFHDGEPVVLVDQSRDGTPDLGETQNTAVKSNFAKIAGGTQVSSTESSASNSSVTTSKINDKTIGVLVSLMTDPKWFKEYVDGTMWYGTNYDGHGSKVDGYSYMTANGDPTSFIYYKTNGNIVTYKEWIPRKSVADGYFRTKTVTLTRLKNDYYSTQSQKAKIRTYLDAIKPESSYNDSLDK
ncbi:Hypothetical protein ADU72_0534 [Pediococcus damnosus]|uniref:Uncharacterized protein n=1 Tax=Pediococcus damnosus TaxID=51663 RepID=A0A0R2HLH6_9LACO|nr:DUF4767 domain-containing protein [Pediococcus damnosus]AMV61014.1 Hypothetical protein ADU69_1361 [Pediococcus damnosus]AMV63583.1 Hypothetical protein ADU70_2117 [Pediococcus damnosus]AMV66479.1 Hypothetical protein ADU72_0534 [Pediococcus damnosus]AMV68779.1 Hypothetical protein ADU73_0369 [Pediococcus damnosus]KRN50244.1 hypothetical protein IV84_GL001283 [Pediococcus damnosus]